MELNKINDDNPLINYQNNGEIEIHLSEKEALDLATHLKEKLQAGLPIDSNPESISAMVAGLGDPRGLLRRSFAESLGSVGQAAVPALCQAMRSSSEVTVKRAAAKTLALIRDPASLPDLLNTFLSDSDSVVQGSTMGAMVSMGENAVDTILGIVENPKTTEMQIGLATWALSLIGERSPEALLSAINSKNTNIRKASISAFIGQIQTLEVESNKKIILDALSDPDPEIRAEAASFLGTIDEEKTIAPLLCPLLSDSDSWVRKNSALSLMKLKSTSSIQWLQERLEHENDEIVLNVLKLSISQLQT